MKRKKINFKYEIVVHLLIICLGVVIAIFYKFTFDSAYQNLCEFTKEEAKKELKIDVLNLVTLIDEYRLTRLNYYYMADDETLDQNIINEKIMSEIHSMISSLETYNNRYFWVNEVINFEGGDNYAIRRLHQNLIATEGDYLSTETFDLANNQPYKSELEGIKKDGEIYQSYYFKNLIDNEVEKKLSYSLLYSPFNWIISSGIPYDDMLIVPYSFRNQYLKIFPFFIIFDAFLVFLGCSFFALYIKKRKIKDQKILAERQNQYKSEFLASMTHNLRTPMNAIVGLTELSKDGNLSREEIDEYLSKIDVSSKYLLTLINDILDISAIEEGKIVLEEDPFDLKDLIKPLIGIYKIKAKENKIDFSYTLHNIQHERLIGDKFRLNQIITNLLSNAFKFTDKGGSVNLDISQSDSVDRFIHLKFVVKDSGCGIDKDKQDVIFNKFEQGQSNKKTNFGGSGLGLFIVKNLTKMMNGTIEIVESNAQGTTIEFIVDLKIFKSEDVCTLLKDNNLLIIEDEKTSRIIENYVTEIGVNCISCHDKEQALQNINLDKTFNFVIMKYESEDFVSSILNAIKQRYLNSLPKIIFTSEYNRNVNEKFKNNFILQKPIFKSDLISVICVGKPYQPRVKQDLDINLAGMKILIVEDNEINQLVAQKIIESKKGTAELVSDGKAAVDIVLKKGENYYDLILMDCQMPIMDGFESTKKIRELPLSYAKDLPIYAMTANNTKNDIDACTLVGMNGYISKPINITVFIDLLMKIWNKKNRI